MKIVLMNAACLCCGFSKQAQLRAHEPVLAGLTSSYCRSLHSGRCKDDINIISRAGRNFYKAARHLAHVQVGHM